MERKDLVKAYINLMGSDVNERDFYKELSFKTDEEIVRLIIGVAFYYKAQCSALGEF